MRPTNCMGALCLSCSLLALNVLPMSAQAQKNNSKSGSSATKNAADDSADSPAGITHKTTPLTPAAYEYLLDVMFPIDRSLSPALDYMMVLRFEPHLHPETQIVIRRFHSGKIEASLSQVATGNAWSAAYQQIVPGESPNFQLIASNIQLRDRRFNVDEQQLETWHKQIFPVLKKQSAKVETKDKEIQRRGKTKDRDVGTIGARYELWFIQLNDEEHSVAWDTETENTPTGSSDLTQWMNKVRLFALGQVNTGSGPTRPGIAKAMPMTPSPVAPQAAEPAAEAAAPVQPVIDQPAAATATSATMVAVPQGQPAAGPAQAVAAQAEPAQVAPSQASALNPVFQQPGTPAAASAPPARVVTTSAPAAATASVPAAPTETRSNAIHLAPAKNKTSVVQTTSALGITTPQAASTVSSAPAPPAPNGAASTLFPQPGHPDTYAAPTGSPSSVKQR